MANNRYFMLCPCGSTHYLGKSLGDGVYARTPPEKLMDSLYEWMWEHLIENHAGLREPDDVLSAEWVAGEIFKVITEYDERAPRGTIPPLVAARRERP